MVDSTTAAPVCTRPAAQDRHPPGEGCGAATIPLRRAPPCIHGPRTSGHGGRGIGHLSAVDRFQSALRARGVEVEPRVLPDSARTAPEAAAAVGTEVGAIVKSLVFRCGDEAVLALVSGANRADEARLEEEFGAVVSRADADFARAATGFSIGGVPPLGHAAPLRTIVDEDLLGYEVVWAAAGTPHAVFPIAPGELAELAGGRVVRLAAPAR
jgi:prolyl-tRNA editing enzyme YbaK/EbsC (Cys-tRNA(Pro) deacylase)